MGSRHWRWRARVVGLVLVLVGAAAACDVSDGPDSGVDTPSVGHATASPPTTTPAQLGGLRPTLDAAAALDALGGLAVAAELTAGYDRDAFGPAWADIDGNGCNQRDDVLVRDAVPGTVRTAAQGACDHDVLAGAWWDPYTATLLTFSDLKDPEQAQAIPIDHVVPLAESHRSGTHSWTPAQREQFANDTSNLVAVGGSANSTKGDQDPAEWLPPAASPCAYAVVWVDVKSRWRLTVDRAEREALAGVLDLC